MAKGRGASRITLADAQQALIEAGKLRRQFYESRYQELVDMELVTYALQAIDIIEEQPGTQIDNLKLIVDLQEMNEGMEYARANKIQKSFTSLGFIYDKGEGYEAGIPSLFDYVKEKGKAVLSQGG